MSNRDVKFNQNYKVKDAEGKKYSEGKTYSMSESSANHFAKRGVAEKILTDAEKKTAKDAIAAEKKDKAEAQLVEDVYAATAASKDANLAVIDAENTLTNATDKDKPGAETYLKEVKKDAAEAAKKLAGLEK